MKSNCLGFDIYEIIEKVNIVYQYIPAKSPVFRIFFVKRHLPIRIIHYYSLRKNLSIYVVVDETNILCINNACSKAARASTVLILIYFCVPKKLHHQCFLKLSTFYFLFALFYNCYNTS